MVKIINSFMATLFLAAIPIGLFSQNIVKPHILFYNVRCDPEELVIRYNDPMYATIVADTKEEMLLHRKRLNETDEKYPAMNDIIPGTKSRNSLDFIDVLFSFGF